MARRAAAPERPPPPPPPAARRTRRLRIHLVTDEPVDALAVIAVKALDQIGIWDALERAAPHGRDLRITPEELAVFSMNQLVGCGTLADLAFRYMGDLLSGKEPLMTTEEAVQWSAFMLVGRAMVADWHRRITP